MNEAAREVVNSLTGKTFKTVTLGGKAYTIREGKSDTICRAISNLSYVDIEAAKIPDQPDKIDRWKLFGCMPANTPPIHKAVAIFIVNSRWNRAREWMVEQHLRSCPWSEINKALFTALSLAGPQDFFDCASLASNVTMMGATQRLL
jgi:hypothetical protein